MLISPHKKKISKIWFASHDKNLSVSGQCDCACDCACASALHFERPKHILPYPETFKLSQFTAGRLSKTLYRQKIHDDAYILWNHKGNNGVFVVNAFCYEVLERFLSGDVKIGEGRDFLENHIITILYKLFQFGLLKCRENDNVTFAHPNKLVAWIHTTNECNLACSYCYLRRDNVCQMKEQIGLDSIASIFHTASKYGYDSIKLKYAGGEPLLNFPLIIKMQELALRQALHYNINLSGVLLSNGNTLTYKTIKILQDLRLKIMISLDGLATYNDIQRRAINNGSCYNQVLSSLKKLKQSGISPDISVTLTDLNAKGLPHLIEYLIDENLPFKINFYRKSISNENPAHLAFSNECITNSMLDAFSVIERKLPRRGLLSALVDHSDFRFPHLYTCGVGQNYFAIDCDGRIAKCQMEIGRNYIGDIYTNDFFAIIRQNKDKFQNVSVEEKEECKYCYWRYQCTGGCPLQSQCTINDNHKSSPNCNIYKKLFPSILRLEALRLLKYGEPIVF